MGADEISLDAVDFINFFHTLVQFPYLNGIKGNPVLDENRWRRGVFRFRVSLVLGHIFALFLATEA